MGVVRYIAVCVLVHIIRRLITIIFLFNNYCLILTLTSISLILILYLYTDMLYNYCVTFVIVILIKIYVAHL